jgi:hypothetical protein
MKGFRVPKLGYYTAHRITNPLRRIPIVGRVAYVFWQGILHEGVRNTLHPVWGAMSFSFLNDGYRPTLYHTWQTLIDGEHNGIWQPKGAPRNAAHAEQMLAEWEREYREAPDAD